MEFKTICKNETAEIVEKKSKFIANIFYVESKEEAENHIKNIKKKYYDAKHHCFAYIISSENENKIKKSSDDGEPSGTAGMPMLEILEKQNLSNVLVIVTRYFGGILLGTGGLLRAYSSATLEVLEKTQIVSKTLGYEVKLEINYKDVEQLKYVLEKEKIKIIDVNYEEFASILIEIPQEKIETFLEKNKEKIKNREIMTKKYVDI